MQGAGRRVEGGGWRVEGGGWRGAAAMLGDQEYSRREKAALESHAGSQNWTRGGLFDSP